MCSKQAFQSSICCLLFHGNILDLLYGQFLFAIIIVWEKYRSVEYRGVLWIKTALKIQNLKGQYLLLNKTKQ